MAYIPTGKELIDPYKLLEDSGIEMGMKVADFGCGTLGHYVFPAAHLVGADGVVYAIDILKSVLSGIESRNKLESVNNVVALRGDLERDNGVKLEDGHLDMGLLINNIFLSEQKEDLVRECVRMVKKDGLFVVVDWKPTGISLGPLSERRVHADEVKKLMEGAGLTLIQELNPGTQHYGFLYKK